MTESVNRYGKNAKTVIAICYDFDKTLSPDDMQAQGFIQSVGYDVGDFWRESNEMASKNDMDQNLSYMLMMLKASAKQGYFTKKKLNEFGSHIKLFNGVETWFGRIREYAESKGITVEHYVISSGLKEMVEGTSIAKEFKRIYANSYYYDEKGIAAWPALVVNYTNKTQFLFRIEKGVWNINDPGVNEPMAEEDLKVPFRNIVYIGDSETDVPCMQLVNANGGYSIGVYNDRTDDKAKVLKMMRENRIKFFVPADYSEGTEMDCLIKSIIDRTAVNEIIEDIHCNCKAELNENDKEINMDQRLKTNLLISLENSYNFANTHRIIEDLKKVKVWTDKEKRILFKIALRNSQVRYILGNADVKEFYESILPDRIFSEEAEKVREIIQNSPK